MTIRFDNLKIGKYTQKTYIAEIINKGKRKTSIVNGVFTIDELRQWKHIIIAFEDKFKEL